MICVRIIRPERMVLWQYQLIPLASVSRGDSLKGFSSYFWFFSNFFSFFFLIFFSRFFLIFFFCSTVLQFFFSNICIFFFVFFSIVSFLISSPPIYSIFLYGRDGGGFILCLLVIDMHSSFTISPISFRFCFNIPRSSLGIAHCSTYFYLYFFFLPCCLGKVFCAGFKIWKEHNKLSSTLIMAPALSNSPQ